MADNTRQQTDPIKEKAGDKKNFVMPKINFMTFVLSLNSSALVHLGAETDPITGNKVANLPLAKQTIDILAMLQEKTKGNLADDEQRLLTHVIYELRLLYVKKRDEC